MANKYAMFLRAINMITAKKDLLFWQLCFHQSCNCWHGFMERY